MGDVQEPQAGTGGAYTAGGNPRPGGKIETEPTPPYEGRTKSPDDTESTRAKTDSIERQLDETVSKGEAEVGQVKSPGGSNVDPATGEDGKPDQQRRGQPPHAGRPLRRRHQRQPEGRDLRRPGHRAPGPDAAGPSVRSRAT